MLLVTAIIATPASMDVMAVRLVCGQADQVTCMSIQYHLNRSVMYYITGRDAATRLQDTCDLNYDRNPKASQWVGGDT